jgi:hypothetical protein
MDRYFERCFEMGQDQLAIFTVNHVLLPENTFLGGKRSVMIRGECFRIGTGFARRNVEAFGTRTGRSGRTKMAREGFFKGAVAVVRRHGLLLPSLY